MANHIPFITSKKACDLVKSIYGDSEYVRVPAHGAADFCPLLASGFRLWIDPGIDGLDNLDQRRSTDTWPNPWYEFIKEFPHVATIADTSFHSKPDKKIVGKFVNAILTVCAKRKPAWITVPQLPMVDNSDRNKINRAFAFAAGAWKSSSDYKGQLILPLVFTHQGQVNLKTARNNKVDLAEKYYRSAQASGLWVVDKSLVDDNGSKTLRNTRFPGIIALHEELNEKIPSRVKVGGPYWGMNLVLWVRGLIDYPAIGVGNSFQYHLSGGHSKQPKVKLALEPLRRRTGVGQLRHWLDDALGVLGTAHPGYSEFAELKKHLNILRDPERARGQVAIFYKNWFDSLAATPQLGRSLALYQELSGAYALGKSLPEIPGEKTARRPESVAEALMLSCL